MGMNMEMPRSTAAQVHHGYEHGNAPVQPHRGASYSRSCHSSWTEGAFSRHPSAWSQPHPGSAGGPAGQGGEEMHLLDSPFIFLIYFKNYFLIWLCWVFVVFPGGSVVKKPPANAGDMGSISG